MERGGPLMLLAFLLPLLALCLVVVVVSYVHLLYRESLRIRPRDLPSMIRFKESQEAQIGLEGEDGALGFSLVRHTALILIAIVAFAMTSRGAFWPGGNVPPMWQATLEAAAVSWLLMMIAGYIAPQFLYRRASGAWVLPFIPLFRACALIVRPILSLLELLQSLADLSESNSHAVEEATPAEHIDALIDAGTETGIILEDDRQLIQSAVAFGAKTVREVMTPRANIVAIEQSKSLDDLRDLLISEQYSRIPVFEDTIDKVIGFIHARDVLELDQDERAKKPLTDILRKINAVPETKAVNDLLREMQADGQHMVVVVDEYGATAGLATMEDLVEEIVGEIRDEHEPTQDLSEEPGGTYVVSGSYDLDHLRQLVQYRPGEDIEATTVGGLAVEWLGHVPQVGEVVERNGVRIEVLAGSDRRVDKLRVSRVAQNGDFEEPNA
jgi:CBS domain containing-hemolysin-like protein